MASDEPFEQHTYTTSDGAQRADYRTANQTWAQNGTEAIDERSLGRLFSDLSADLSSLIRKEVLLARTETMEKVSTAARGAGAIGAGAMVAYAGFLCLMAAAVLGLATLMPLWLSALIVAVVLLIVGMILIQSGRSMLHPTNLTPTKTIDTMKDNAELVKEKIQ
jgi:hypothetical protein